MAMYKFPSKQTEGENFFVQFDIFQIAADKTITQAEGRLESVYNQSVSGDQGLGQFKELAGSLSMENIGKLIGDLNLTLQYEHKASELLHSIKLPLQMAPIESTKGNFQDESTRDTQTILDLMSGRTPEFTRAMALAQDETVDTVAKTLNRLSNRATNQMQQTFYEGPSKRDYSFNFSLLARNYTDSQRIEEIVQRFHYHASAGKRGVEFFEYPEMVRFFFVDSNGKPMKVFSHSGHHVLNNADAYESKSCFITDVSAEYGLMGDNIKFQDPNNSANSGLGSVKLTISLKETEYFTKEDYNDSLQAVSPTIPASDNG